MKGWRGRLLMTGAALLYTGAAATGAGLPLAAAIPTVMALLLLYTLLMRPMNEWAANGAMFVLTLLVLAVLSTVLALIGNGAARLTGPVPGWAGPLLGAAGIALCRLIWSAGKAAEMDHFLDQAIRGIEGLSFDIPDESEDPGSRRLHDLDPRDQAILRHAFTRIEQLPPYAADGSGRTGSAYQMADILDPLETPGLFDVALTELSLDERPAFREAAALLALRPYVANRIFGQFLTHDAVLWALRTGVPQVAYAVAYAAAETLDGSPMLWHEMPDPEKLRDIADTMGGPDYVPEAIRTLADRVEAIRDDEEGVA